MMPARTKLEDNWPQMADTLVERWRATHCKAAAWKAVGITAPTLEDYLNRGAKGEEPFLTFFQRWEKAEADWIAERCLTIRQAAQAGTWQAAAWDLERHLPEDFALRQRHEVTGAGGGAIEHKHETSLRVLADPEACALATALIERVSGGAEPIADEPGDPDESAAD